MQPPEPFPTRSQDTPGVIRVTRLTKRFAEATAVNGVSFEVRRGELFGFLGPNGAGKTTTINLLTGLARPDSGSVLIGDIDCARDPKAAQHLIGVVPDESNLYPELTGFENLCFCAALYGMRKSERRRRAQQLLESFGLTDAAHRKFAGYSRGMKRKLTIAAGIMHKPEILFLDEPTTGLDVLSARQIRQMIVEMHRSGTTIFLTTHYIDEAERMCERVGFIVDGRIVRIDTVANLLRPWAGKQVLLLSFDRLAPGIDASLARSFPDLHFTIVSDTEIRVETTWPVRVASLVRFFEDRGVDVVEARRLQPSLEDIFVRITGVEAESLRMEKEKPEAGPLI
jgi:ABC-2 type transport system ATP-binding protein